MIHPTRSDHPRWTATRRKVWLFLLVALAGASFTTNSCRNPGESETTASVDQRATSRPASEAPSAEPTESIEPLTPPIPERAWSRGRWLEVITPESKTPGGWATGSFDPDKNKLVIDTHDVGRFIVKTDRIRIDWDRVVILSLNGVNSELRRREAAVLTFELDDHGQWVVLEPPANENRE